MPSSSAIIFRFRISRSDIRIFILLSFRIVASANFLASVMYSALFSTGIHSSDSIVFIRSCSLTSSMSTRFLLMGFHLLPISFGIQSAWIDCFHEYLLFFFISDKRYSICVIPIPNDIDHLVRVFLFVIAGPRSSSRALPVRGSAPGS